MLCLKKRNYIRAQIEKLTVFVQVLLNFLKSAGCSAFRVFIVILLSVLVLAHIAGISSLKVEKKLLFVPVNIVDCLRIPF